MSYLSVTKRGFSSKFDLVEILNAILYKLKIGCQWRMLPVGHLFSGEPPSWKTVFHHFRKWSKAKEWKEAFTNLLNALFERHFLTPNIVCTSLKICKFANA